MANHRFFEKTPVVGDDEGMDVRHTADLPDFIHTSDARLSSTPDHIAKGHFGWNIVTSAEDTSQACVAWILRDHRRLVPRCSVEGWSGPSTPTIKSATISSISRVVLGPAAPRVEPALISERRRQGIEAQEHSARIVDRVR